MSTAAAAPAEFNCPRCRASVHPAHALGLKPLPPEPGQLRPCRKCGSMLVVRLDRTLRFATRDEIDDEVRVHPHFRFFVEAAERTRRQYIARKAGFKTAAGGAG